jgi:ribonuclease BN (tRNA processing enzyme)
VVGCAGSFPGPDSAASCYLVEAEHGSGAQRRTWRLLIDLGNGALGPLQRVCDPCTLDAVAVSHLHADHVADLVVLNVLRRYRPEGPCGPVDLYGPQGTAERLAQMAGVDPATDVSGQFAVHDWVDGEVVTVGPFEVTAVAVEHPVPAYGLRVTGPSEQDPGRRVVLGYSGDTDTCAGLRVVAAGADLFLAEAAFVEGRDDAVRGVHLTGRRAGATAAESGAQRLVLTHLIPWNDPAATLAEARAEYLGPIDLARPGAVYPL